MRFDQKVMRWGLYVLVFLGFVQILAQKWGLYWIYPDFDIPMHFLGGVWLGFVATWFGFRFKLIPSLNSFGYLAIIGFIVLVFGIGWEFFEYIMDIIVKSNMQPSWIDTKLDLVMDLLGGYLVGLFLMLTSKTKES